GGGGDPRFGRIDFLGNGNLHGASGGAGSARASKLALFPLSWIPVSQPADVQIFLVTAGASGAEGDASGQEEAHQGDNHDDGGGSVFDQHDEPFIGLLM